MIRLSPEARAQIRSLSRFYADKQRPQAIRNLAHAIAEASLIISSSPERGLPAPRPYPHLAALGFRWIKRGRYWFAYTSDGAVMAGVFFETDDIPNRLPSRRPRR